MATGDHIASGIEIVTQEWVIAKIDKAAIFSKGIDDALPTPLHFTRLDIPGCHQRQFSIRLHIERFKIPDECLICTRCNADADLATRLL